MSIRMRHTRGHTGNRRSHHALSDLSVVKDAENGNLRLPHRLDETTGMYRGRQIAPAKVVRVKQTEGKGPDTTPAPSDSHDHDHKHENAEAKVAKSKTEQIPGARRPNGEVV